MDTTIMDDLTQDDDTNTSADTTDTAPAPTANIPPTTPGGRRRGRWLGPTAYQIISDHLEAHNWITEEIATQRYGISKGSFNSTISYLKHDGWTLGTTKYRDSVGRSRSKYHVIEETEQAQEAAGDGQLSAAEPRVTTALDWKKTVAQSPQPPSQRSHTVAVRIGADGLEVQLAASNAEDTAPFYKLTQKQVEYLITNFKLYQALSNGD